MQDKRCVYVLKGKKHYVGSTNNLNRRLEEHKRGHTYSTKRIGERKLLGFFECENEIEARELEKRIKKSKQVKRWIGKGRWKSM